MDEDEARDERISVNSTVRWVEFMQKGNRDVVKSLLRQHGNDLPETLRTAKRIHIQISKYIELSPTASELRKLLKDPNQTYEKYCPSEG